MKKIFLSILIISSLSTFAVEKGDFHVNVTTNLGHHQYIGGVGTKSGGLGFVPGVTVNMDFAVSPYFSLGGWFTFAGKNMVVICINTNILELAQEVFFTYIN
ncbi:MAG: hypothetical protein IPK18_04240 [Sphingobacteriales bacterium]|nr:MAG: hypothetical protein IPK18_04240 [Sphingobacteriales bacterium]